MVEERTAFAGRDAFRTHLPRPSRPTPGPSGDTRIGRQQRTPHPDGWRPGLKVRHATFGPGVILQVQGTDAQTRLVVFFDRAGRKTLIPSLAKLERV